MVDIPGNSTTTATIGVGGSLSNSLETIGDHDWFRITLDQGQSISISLTSNDFDSYLRVRDAAGNLLYENDDSGGALDSRVAFSAPAGGTYYIDVGSYDDAEAGAYQLAVDNYTPPPIGTVNQIANYLSSGYWGGDAHHFAVSQGGSLTVNLVGLTNEGRTLAREALGLWSDVIGVQFVEVTNGGQITFDDNEEGAFSEAVWWGGITQSANVNVGTDWLNDYRGDGLDSYAFQSYVHEVGHALGLGHAGDYNFEASFPYDAVFLNDGWPVSIMSYFDQDDSTYYANLGFSQVYTITPMLADVLAMDQLYGLSTTTRTGDTVYGFNSTAGRDVFNASLYPNIAYTIVDSGGTDTLDYSGFGADQKINLNSEIFFNVGGLTGNVVIARDTDIENAIGGGGNDELTGNGAGNFLIGNAGNDQLYGRGGNDQIRGGAGDDRISGDLGQDWVYYDDALAAVTVLLSGGQSATSRAGGNAAGIGTDSLFEIEHVVGSAFDDYVFGTNAENQLLGGGGNDDLFGYLGNDQLYGDAGNDVLDGGEGGDFLTGGGGVDQLDGGEGSDIYSIASAAEHPSAEIDDSGASGTDEVRFSATTASTLTLFAGDTGIERIVIGTGTGTTAVTTGVTAVNVNASTLGNGVAMIGNAGANVLTATAFSDTLDGGSGADRLYGNAGNDTLDGGTGEDKLYGGTGDDIYVVDVGGDATVELAGEGTDLVEASLSHTLKANIENLTLTGPAALDGTGNELGNVLTGNNAANRLDGLAGADQLIGNGGDDTLDGGLGDDLMTGGLGNDSYVVDSAGDLIVENIGQGTDNVKASVSHILQANIETLTLTGTASDGTGNTLANILNGNAVANFLAGDFGADRLYGLGGNDRLHGGVGDDKLYGGLGDDIYIVDDGDATVELAGEGTDLVRSSISHTLKANIENLTLTGLTNLTGTGNELGNVLTGYTGINRLYGLGGNDTLDGGEGGGEDKFYGGTGDDIYVVDNAGDATVELLNEGNDTVRSSITHGLKANIENLELTGAAADGTGNALANVLIGNNADNRLTGLAGSDTLDGGGGRDSLYGGTGADSFLFQDGGFASSSTLWCDVIGDFSQAEGDTIRLDLVDANSGLAGDQGFAFIGADLFHGTAGELRYEQIDGNTYLQGDTNGDSIADFMIRLDGLHALTSNDFML